MKLRKTVIFASCMLALFFASAAKAERMTWMIDGVEREALVFAPPAATTEELPVVFGFHWYTGAMQYDMQVFRFQELWREAIVVYMQGLPTMRRPSPNPTYGWQHEKGEFGDRDLRFFDAVLATLREKYAVDDRRIYGSGFGDGSDFLYLLWEVRAKTFAAFALVAGYVGSTVHLTVPKPVYCAVGKKDRGFQRIMESIKMVRELNGTAPEGEPCGEDCTAYPSSQASNQASSQGAPVVTYIHPQGHVYPLPISAKFVAFFKQHTLGN